MCHSTTVKSLFNSKKSLNRKSNLISHRTKVILANVIILNFQLSIASFANKDSNHLGQYVLCRNMQEKEKRSKTRF